MDSLKNLINGWSKVWCTVRLVDSGYTMLHLKLVHCKHLEWTSGAVLSLRGLKWLGNSRLKSLSTGWEGYNRIFPALFLVEYREGRRHQ